MTLSILTYLSALEKMVSKSTLLEDIEKKELWAVCIHEYGHSVVGNTFGIQSWTDIWRNESGDFYEKAWRGQTIHSEITGEQLILFSMAGIVSEILLINFLDENERYTLEDAESDAEIIRKKYSTGRHRTRTAFTQFCYRVLEAINEKYDNDELSETDLIGMGNYSINHVRKTVRLVLKNSEEIIEMATLNYNYLFDAENLELNEPEQEAQP
jgi:energy-coupling factor transporter ATP-binding protein EcfA2